MASPASNSSKLSKERTLAVATLQCRSERSGEYPPEFVAGWKGDGVLCEFTTAVPLAAADINQVRLSSTATHSNINLPADLTLKDPSDPLTWTWVHPSRRRQRTRTITVTV
eukprot:gene9645-8607_t